MLTIYTLKPLFQSILRPILKILHRRGISANQVTLSAIVISVITGTYLAIFPEPEAFIILPFILFIRMALNAIDGLLAREFNQQSRSGAILNETGDVISDVALYLPFALLPHHSPLLVTLVVLLAVMTEFCGVLTQTLVGKRDYAGPFGKSDRAAAFGLWSIIIFCWPGALLYGNTVLGVMALLLLWTIINRCRAALVQEV